MDIEDQPQRSDLVGDETDIAPAPGVREYDAEPTARHSATITTVMSTERDVLSGRYERKLEC